MFAEYSVRKQTVFEASMRMYIKDLKKLSDS